MTEQQQRIAEAMARVPAEVRRQAEAERRAGAAAQAKIEARDVESVARSRQPRRREEY